MSVTFFSPLSTASTHIFRAIDQARPVRSRNTSLLEAANKDPITAIRFSAALSLDEEDPSFKVLQRAAVLSSDFTLDVEKH